MWQTRGPGSTTRKPWLSEGWTKIALMESPCLETSLREFFGHNSFRDGQKEIVECVLQGQDVLAVLPTGGGKSLLFQLPAFLLPGATIAVSPLISLMKDQVDQLRARGLPAALLNSSQDLDEQDRTLEKLARGDVKLLYVAPERFKSTRFVNALTRVQVALLAVDEAHCVSEWGHDFRPDYLKIGEAARALGRPPILAVTATATEPVRKEIAQGLALRDGYRTFVRGFDRPNLRFSAVPSSGDAEKEKAVRAALDRTEGARIVYCATRKSCERLAARIPGAALYHAGLSGEARHEAQERWASGRSPIIVATNAFGLGINKEDVRLVVHHDLPSSLEAYYQEAGRAGRDGKPAECVLVFSGADVQLQTFLTESAYPERATVLAVLAALRRSHGATDAGSLRDGIPSSPSERAIQSSLKLLAEAGAARREYGDGGELFEATPDESEPRISWDRLDRLRERERERLQAMLRYARSSGCRRLSILRHFGAPPAPCGRCDGCERLENDALPQDEAKTVARKTLSLVARLRGRFGRQTVARLLAGLATKEDKDRGLETIPTVGALKPWSTDDCAAAVDVCLDHGLLLTITDDGRYPKLTLTNLGIEVLLDKKTVELAIPRPQAKAAKSKSKDKKKKPALTAGDVDTVLLASLKAWRRSQSQSEKVPPYCVFHDSTLEAIAQARPRDHVALLLVPGLGPRKAEKYGERVLELVRGGV